MSPRWTRRTDEIDEPDLYPADVEHVTPELRSQRNRAIFGAGLITIGCGLLIERAFNTHLDYFGLAVGLGLLAGWAQVRRYAMFVAGALFAGSGAGSLLTSALHVPFESTLSCMLIAAAFFAIWVRYPFKSRWALVPAGIFSFLAVGSFGVSLIGLVPSSILGVLLPGLLVIGGGVLLLRNALPRRLVRGALVTIAVVFVASAASGVGKWDGGPHPLDRRGRMFGPAAFASIPPLPGSTDPLEIRTTSGNVTFGIAEELSISGMRAGGSHDVHVMVPEDFDREVHVSTISGDVDGALSGSRLVVTSVSGKVDVQSLGTGDVLVRTMSGRVEVAREGIEDGDLNLSTLSGDVEVNDHDYDGGFQHEGAGPSVEISTLSGDIDLHD